MMNKFLIGALLLVSAPALAKFTYEGYLTEIDGVTPETSSNVQVRLRVQNPLASCLLYEETQAVDLSTSNGYFSVNIGDGSGTPTDYSGLGLEPIFANHHTVINGQASCAYNPTAGDSRKIAVQVRVDGGAWEDFGSINYHPAQNSVNSEKVGKYSPQHLLRVEDGGVPMPATVLTSSNMTELMNLIGGTSSLYAPPGASGISALTGDVTTPGGGSGAATISNGAVTYAKMQTVAGSRLLGNATGAPTTASEVYLGAGLQFTGGTTLSVADTGVAPGSYGTASQIPQISVDSTGRITSANQVALSVGGSAVGGLAVNSIVTTNGAGYLTTPSCTVNQVMQFNGSGWVCASLPPGGLALDGSQSMTGQIRAYVGTAATPGYGFASASGNGMYYTGSNSLGFSTSGIERMVLDGNGKIGIGVAPSGTHVLSVQDLSGGPTMLLLRAAGASNNTGIDMLQGSGNGSRFIWNPNTGNTELIPMAAGAPTGDPQLIVKRTTGIVGIGTTNPTANLHVAATSASTASIYADGFGAGNSGNFIGRQAGGSPLSLSPTMTADVIAQFGGKGYYNPSYSQMAGMKIFATENHTNTAQGTAISFTTITNAQNTPTERLRIDGAGNVGIGTTAPSEKVHIMGNLRVQGSTDCTLGNGSGGTSCSSDARLKTDVVEIQNSLEKINSLRGVEFTWNEKSRNPGGHAMGVIAQEVEKRFPTAVMQDPNSGYKKVDYAVLVAPVINAIKELYAQFLAQDEEVARLKQENAAIKAYLCAKDPSASICQ